jgi:hypothetical protein
MNGHHFKLGAEVRSGDKLHGHLRKIAVEPNNWQVTHLIVERGLLFKQAKTIPVTHTQRTSAKGIDLAIDADELDEFEDYEETVVVREASDTESAAPAANEPPMPIGWATMAAAELPRVAPYMPPTTGSGLKTVEEKVHLGISEEDVVLDEDTVIGNLDEAFGRLVGIVAEVDSYYLNAVIGSQADLIDRPFVLPSSSVKSLGHERIQVTPTRAEIEELVEHTDVWNDDEPQSLDRSSQAG